MNMISSYLEPILKDLKYKRQPNQTAVVPTVILDKPCPFLILKSNYIYSVKFKKIIALSLVSIVVLSSVGLNSFGFSTVQTSSKDTQSTSVTQFVVDDQDPSHEFREGFMEEQTSQSKTASCSSLFEASQFVFQSTRSAQYDSYLQRRLTQHPSVKLFLDFRSLSI